MMIRKIVRSPLLIVFKEVCAMPRGRIIGKDKVQALSNHGKTQNHRIDDKKEIVQVKSTLSIDRYDSSPKKQKQDKKNKTEKRNFIKSNMVLPSPKGNDGVLKSKSEGLIRKFSNLKIGGPWRTHPLQQTQVPKYRYLSTFTVNSLNQIAELLRTQKLHNVIVMTGAGISTPSGIPDFRTPGSGLYDNLQEYNLPYPTAVFDIYYFSENPKPFFKLAKELYPGLYKPNFVHYFLRVLHEKGLLLRLYTQNIDALERFAGIPSEKLVEAHGSFATATCMICRAKYTDDEIKSQIMKGEIPFCHRAGCKGVVKPDVVFFGEDLPRRFYKFQTDFSKCDLLIVLGTSLEVEPFASLVYEVKRSTPRLLINREVVSVFKKNKRRPNDVVAKGDIIDQVEKLAEMLDWKREVNHLLSDSE